MLRKEEGEKEIMFKRKHRQSLDEIRSLDIAYKELVASSGFELAFSGVQRASCAIEKKKGLQKYKNNELYVPTKLALIMSEAVEALEWHRAGKDKEIGHDLADIVLRTMDLAGVLKINLGKEILKKYRINVQRAKKKSRMRY